MTQESFLAEYIILSRKPERSPSETQCDLTEVILIRKATGERLDTNIFSSSEELGRIDGFRSVL